MVSPTGRISKSEPELQRLPCTSVWAQIRKALEDKREALPEVDYRGLEARVMKWLKGQEG